MKTTLKPTTLRDGCWRMVEIACSLTGVLLLSPLFVIIALLILWDDGLPVFFLQTRIGKNGRPFRMWKFRTMRNGSAGGKITAGGDRRVTLVGARLRKYKLDELPQLLNVLKGDMSLIGPRPEVPEFVDLTDPTWRKVLQVRPGITDAATLIYRDEEAILRTCGDPEEYYRKILLPIKLQINLQHLSSRTLLQDIRLLALTIRYSFCPRGFDENCWKRILNSRAEHHD